MKDIFKNKSVGGKVMEQLGLSLTKKNNSGAESSVGGNDDFLDQDGEAQ